MQACVLVLPATVNATYYGRELLFKFFVILILSSPNVNPVIRYGFTDQDDLASRQST